MLVHYRLIGKPHPFDPNHNKDAVMDHDDVLLAVEEPNSNDKMIGADAFRDGKK